MALLLRGPVPQDIPGPSYNPDTVLGGLVDVWHTVSKVVGHKPWGPLVAQAIDWLDAAHSGDVEKFLSLNSIPKLDCDAVESIITPLRVVVADTISPD